MSAMGLALVLAHAGLCGTLARAYASTRTPRHPSPAPSDDPDATCTPMHVRHTAALPAHILCVVG